MAKPQITVNKPQLGAGGKKKLPKLNKGEIAANFDSLFGAIPAEETPDPFSNVNYTGDIEEDALEETGQIMSAFYKAEKERRDYFRALINDPEYWCVLCFQTRDQKEKFLEALGLLELGDKYLDGLKVAEKLGVELEHIPLQKRKPPKPPVLLRQTDVIPLKKGGEV